jgi:C-terminal processing protease CtpA/Prc
MRPSRHSSFRPSDVARPLLACLGLLALVGCSEGWRGGIHAQMAWSAERGLRVLDVPAGPARRAGLRADDRIVAIDRVPVEGRPIAEVVAELRGEVGTRVRLTVERGGQVDGGTGAEEQPTEDLEIERAPYAED